MAPKGELRYSYIKNIHSYILTLLHSYIKRYKTTVDKLL